MGTQKVGALATSLGSEGVCMTVAMKETLNGINQVREFLERCLAAKLASKPLSLDDNETWRFYVNLAEAQGREPEDLVNEAYAIICDYSSKASAVLEVVIKASSPRWEQIILQFYEFANLTHDFVGSNWYLLPPACRETLKLSASNFVASSNEAGRKNSFWTKISIKLQIFLASIRVRRNLFRLYDEAVDLFVESISDASQDSSTFKKSSVPRIDEKLRAIAYSIDTLSPGVYIWLPGLRFRLGGSKPDDEPYRYPGVIHASFGIAIVLPGYHVLSTYCDTHDPRQA